MTIADATAALETTLAQQGLENRVLSAHGISGLILAVISAPELIMPSEWLPLTFLDEEGPAFADKKSAERFHGDLMALWNAWIQVLDQEEPPALSECYPAYRLGEDDEPAPELQEFCTGVLKGYDWLQELWFELIEKRGGANNELGHMHNIALLTALLLRDPEGFREMTREDGTDFDALTTGAALEALLPALHSLGQVGQMASREQPDENGAARPEPQENPYRHIGRNDPCPCGSGKKYKKCCLDSA